MSGMKAQAAAAYAGLEHAPKAMAAATFGSSTATAAAPKTAGVPKSGARRAGMVVRLVPRLHCSAWWNRHWNDIVTVWLVEPVTPPPLRADFGRFHCIKKSQIRAGSEMDSEKAGIMGVGEVSSSSGTHTTACA